MVRVGMDGGFGGMEENKKSASPKKNCGYSLLDRIVYGDAGRWEHGCGGAAAEKGCALL